MDLNDMKKLAFVICLVLTANASFAENQNQILKENITQEYSDNVQTVADAVKSILSVSGYHLASYADQDQYAQAMLSQVLNPNQRKMIKEGFRRAILTLVGDDFNIVINNANKSILLKTKESLVSDSQKNSLVKSSNIKHTVLDKFFKLKDYNTRVSQPLVNELSTKPSQYKLEKYYSNHQIFFGINPNDHIVAIAGTQKQANALSAKTPNVFFAIKGDTLNETIQRWANLSGYQAHYSAQKDLILEATSAFYGSFNSQDGVLAHLISSASAVGLNLKAQFNSNNVVVIKDNAYSPILLGGSNDK
jgi:hypothetical protein